MNNMRTLSALAFAIVLAGAQSGYAAGRKCESDSSGDDTKIKTDVQALLDGHAEFGPPNSIRVQSVDHTVYLYGLVSTGLEKWTAESIASRVPDVAGVVNSIEESN